MLLESSLYEFAYFVHKISSQILPDSYTLTPLKAISAFAHDFVSTPFYLHQRVSTEKYCNSYVP